jgi:hypothetical protein
MEGNLAGVENACCLDAGMGSFRTSANTDLKFSTTFSQEAFEAWPLFDNARASIYPAAVDPQK